MISNKRQTRASSVAALLLMGPFSVPGPAYVFPATSCLRLSTNRSQAFCRTWRDPAEVTTTVAAGNDDIVNVEVGDVVARPIGSHNRLACHKEEMI